MYDFSICKNYKLTEEEIKKAVVDLSKRIEQEIRLREKAEDEGE